MAAGLLKFNLGARRCAGAPVQLARSEAPPAPEARPDPLRLKAKKAARGIGKAVKGGPLERASALPSSQLVRQAATQGSLNGGKPPKSDTQGRKPWSRFLPVAAGLLALALVTLPSTALADDPDDEEDPGWRLDGIYFQPPDPVPGRRIFIEGLTVTGNTARVSLRAAHDLDLKVLVFGGRTGRTLKMGANAIVHSGERKGYNLILNGPSPSFTFSWTDSLGFSVAVSLKSDRIPYPLPGYDGGLCDLEVTSLEWTPGQINGVISPECITDTRHEVDLPV